MKGKVMKLIVLIFLITTVHAEIWKREKEKFNFLSEDITFSNRAFCANRAAIPTDKVFLLVDNVNIAKAAFRLSKIKGFDAVQTTKFAVQKFRYSLITLIRIIGDQLLSGKLPFVEESKINHEYLKKNWHQIITTNLSKSLRCSRIKKWGSLHSYMNVSKPDNVLLEEMARDLENLQDTYESCEIDPENEHQEVDLFKIQFEKNKNFDQIGFEFWYSLKIYLSWAFRFSKELEQLAFPFDFLLRSSDLEEMILFFSAGCESITRPECSEGQLNLNSLAQLSIPKEDFDFFQSERVRPVTSPETENFFSKPLPLKEDDLLNLSKTPNTEEWGRNFRSHFIKTRGFQKVRLNRALSNLNVIQSALLSDKILTKIQSESQHTEEEWKKDLFYLCSEYTVASKNYLSKISSNLDKLAQSAYIPEIAKYLSLNDIDSSLTLFSHLSSQLLVFCKDLEGRDFWKDVIVDKTGFAPWYLQITRDEIIVENQTLNLTSLSGGQAFLTLYGDQVFCRSGTHCARILLDSLFSLSSVAQSFSSIVPNEITSTNFGNPYSSHMACGAYDPWAKKNKLLFEFFHDIAQASLFGFLPTPVYVSADLNPEKLVSFKELMKEGKVFYDPQYTKKTLSLSLISDLGPFLGVPCSISISGNSFKPLEYYTFNGISFSGCREQSRSNVTVSENEEMSSSSRKRSYCGSCAINLRTLSTSFARMNPVLRFSTFLVKAFVRLSKNLLDPHDRPKSWSISPQKLALSYRFHGEITKGCARKLLKGKSCLPIMCEREVMETFTRMYEVSPVSSNFNCFLSKGVVHVKECETPIDLRFKDQLRVNTSCHLKRRVL